MIQPNPYDGPACPWCASGIHASCVKPQTKPSVPTYGGLTAWHTECCCGKGARSEAPSSDSSSPGGQKPGATTTP